MPEAAEQTASLSSETMPATLKADYEKATPPPNFEGLSPSSFSFLLLIQLIRISLICFLGISNGGEPASKKYSNPEFFLEAFIKEQEMEMEELKQEKKRRKREKLAQKRTYSPLSA